MLQVKVTKKKAENKKIEKIIDILQPKHHHHHEDGQQTSKSKGSRAKYSRKIAINPDTLMIGIQ